ncbi:uncharacterized protein LOC117113158 isoform X2 [Anneissia japonica]|uniref:uncharacterized protein LOC117113158 isoform X2 n=1 Tax=Anneissia japonica TaxID=1529436 RepID=UPI0014254C4D|nr:uncharacterized protein LOC117113158 isoform X2 [Anneissia japonica]
MYLPRGASLRLLALPQLVEYVSVHLTSSPSDQIMDHLRSIGFHVRNSFQNAQTNADYREDIELCPKNESNVSYMNKGSEKNGHLTMENTDDVGELHPQEVTTSDTPVSTGVLGYDSV